MRPLTVPRISQTFPFWAIRMSIRPTFQFGCLTVDFSTACHVCVASSGLRSRGELTGRRLENAPEETANTKESAQARTFHGLNALSSSSPSIANATDGKCREITAFIEFSSTQSIPCFV